MHRADRLKLPTTSPSCAPGFNPIGNVRQYLRQNWLSNTAFEDYEAILDAWRKLVASHVVAIVLDRAVTAPFLLHVPVMITLPGKAQGGVDASSAPTAIPERGQ